LLIRNVPSGLKLELARAARANGRSQSAEVIARLQQTSGEQALPVRLDLHFGSAVVDTTWSRAEIYGQDAR
jgi:plasmid stability protein